MKIMAVSSACLNKEVDLEVVGHLEATKSFILRHICYFRRSKSKSFYRASSDLKRWRSGEEAYSDFKIECSVFYVFQQHKAAAGRRYSVLVR